MDQVLPGGSRLRVLEETGSTNTECLDAAISGECGRLWIQAHRQTAARGSRGRQWTSYEGNLFASLLFNPTAPTAKLGQITFVAALAVHDALVQQIEAEGINAKIELKWPNDVLLQSSKVCGILLESHEISGIRIVIIGIGLNCFSHPQETTYPATSLQQHRIKGTARDMLNKIAPLMDHWLKIWECGNGFKPIRDAWMTRAKGVGSPIAVKLQDSEYTGIFEDIDDVGRLVLRKRDGSTELISAADIFFLNAAQTG